MSDAEPDGKRPQKRKRRRNDLTRYLPQGGTLKIEIHDVGGNHRRRYGSGPVHGRK